ncbi:MAG: L-seryl-tRNA(Sec) selenium transferase [Bacteroidales bacterium]
MTNQDKLRNLPGVDKLMQHPQIAQLLKDYPREFVVQAIRSVLGSVREEMLSGGELPPEKDIINHILIRHSQLTTKSLKPVINATGVIIHTNLGRAPFGEFLLDDVRDILTGYSNLEFNLQNADRGSRYVHVTNLLKHLTGAEDILVVNNNAAAIMLVLRAMAKNREVIISRGELIEIGGSFRMPDIMAASDCKMIEVGTTNKTKISDFEQAVTERTAMLLKAHQSNYVIKGFTVEASLDEMVSLGRKHEIPVVYDMGSGLLRKAEIEFLSDEPDVQTTLKTGIDLVTFSGDKLLGGPQAGIIAGKKKWIDWLKKEPMTRALRVGKTTLAMLESICLAYLDEKKLLQHSPVFDMMNARPEVLKNRAAELSRLLSQNNVPCRIVESEGQAGGGSLPEKRIKSFAVQIEFHGRSRNERTKLAETIFKNLLLSGNPLLGVLRQGNLIFDVLTVPEKLLTAAADQIAQTYREVTA